MKGRDLKIIFMGTPEFAEASLRELCENGYNVVAVVTMPDKPAGRGLKLQQSAVKKYAVEKNIPVLQPEKLKNPDFIAELQSYNADLFIVVAFRMLPEMVWAMPRLGTFNLHASLLPQYRGAAPINRAIMNGDTVTGVTTFFLNHKIDEGAIIGREEVEISAEDNAGTLHDKLMEVGKGLVLATVEKIANGDFEPIPQDEIPVEELRNAPKIFKDECKVDFNKNGIEIINFIRGLSPYPAAWSDLGKNTFKIFEAVYEPADQQGECSKIYSDNKNYLKISCKDGYINITDLQLSSRKRMKVQDLLRGFKLP